MIAAWRNVGLVAHLRRLGLPIARCERIRSGGSLKTYLAYTTSAGGAGSRCYVVKRAPLRSALARRLGTSPNLIIDAEWTMTAAFGEAGLGPPVVARDGDIIVREYWEGTSLSSLLQSADESDAEHYLADALSLLQRMLVTTRQRGLIGYVDAACRNFLRRPKGQFFVIDHEWFVLKYRTFEEMETTAIARLLGDFLAFGPRQWTVERLFQLVAQHGYSNWTSDAIRDRLAVSYYRTTDLRLLAKLHQSPDLMRRLAATAWEGSPNGMLQSLCERLNERGLRWCFRRSYRHLWANDEYREKDIDLLLHPDDLMSFTDAARSLGFVSCRDKKFIRYCGLTAQCLVGSVDVCGIANAGDMAIRALLDRRLSHGWRWQFNDVDQCAVNVVDAARVKGFLKASYADEIADVLRQPLAQGRLYERLGSVWPEATVRRVMDELRSGRWEAAVRVGKRAERRAQGRINSDLVVKVRAVFRYSGLRTIAFLGVDGAGKTTSLKLAAKALTQLGYRADVRYLGAYYPPSGRGQSLVLPTDKVRYLLWFLRSHDVYLNRQFNTPCAQTNRTWLAPAERGGPLRRFAFGTYGLLLLADCFLMGVLLRLKRGNGFLLADRYLYDLVTYFGARHPLSRAVARLYPPDRVIYFYADEKTHVAREPRHPLSEIRANQALYRLIPAWNSRIDWVEVCTDLPLAVTMQRVLYLCLSRQRHFSVLGLAGFALGALAQRCVQLIRDTMPIRSSRNERDVSPTAP